MSLLLRLVGTVAVAVVAAAVVVVVIVLVLVLVVVVVIVVCSFLLLLLTELISQVKSEHRLERQLDSPPSPHLNVEQKF